MKIDRNKSLRQNLLLNRKNDPAKVVKAQGNFKRTLEQAQKEDVTVLLDQLMEVIEDKAKKLKKNMSLKNLAEYRHYVKKFLHVFNEEFLETDQSYSWQRGSMKSYTIVKEIDESMESLRDLFLEEQKDTLKIVQEVDAICGLLVDLYM